MPLTEPDLWISHIRLFTNTLFNSHIKNLTATSDIRRRMVFIVSSNSVIGLCLTSPLRINANPFECSFLLNSQGITPVTPLL